MSLSDSDKERIYNEEYNKTRKSKKKRDFLGDFLDDSFVFEGDDEYELKKKARKDAMKKNQEDDD